MPMEELKDWIDENSPDFRLRSQTGSFVDPLRRSITGSVPQGRIVKHIKGGGSELVVLISLSNPLTST